MIFKLFLIITGLSATLCVNFFRKDYTYVKEHDAFYKVVHSAEGQFFDKAFKACDNDGSLLFYPGDNNEWKVINNLVEALSKAPNTTEVLLGIRDEIGNGNYLTVDGNIVTSNIHQHDSLPLDCVVMDRNTGTLKDTSCKVATNPRLFVCKKMDDSHCPTVDKGYVYKEDTKKCYKVNPTRKSWHDAMATCYMEGGLLLVVESYEEARVIGEILRNSPETESRYHSGFRKISDNFYTLKGKRLEDSFKRCHEDEPPTPRNPEQYMYVGRNPHEFNSTLPLLGCGAIYNNNELCTSSINCKDRNPFICEIKARF